MKRISFILIFIAEISFSQETFTFQQGVDGYYGCEDAHIFIDKPDWNTGNEDMFEATGNGGEGDAKHALIRFDLTQIPADIQIDSAWVYFYFTQRRTTQTGIKRLSVYRLNRSWGEGSGNDPGGYDGRFASQGECNWNYAFFDSAPWLIAGCDSVPDDREENFEDFKAFSTDILKNTWHSWSITNMCQLWITHPDSNFGFVLREPVISPAGGILDFASSEYNVIYYRPKLYVRLSPQPETLIDTVTESHTYNSISVNANYRGDTDRDGSAIMSYKLSDETGWGGDTAMVKEPFLYKCTITDLSFGSVYDIKITYYDPDSVVGENPKFIKNIQLYPAVTFTDSITAEILSPNIIKVKAPFSGDANKNGTANLEYKFSTNSYWIYEGIMSRMDSSFQKTLVGLTPDTNYDVRVTYEDPDGVEGENPRLIYNIHTPSNEESVILNSWDSTHFNITMGNYTIEYDKNETEGDILIYPTFEPSNALATKIVHGSLFDLMIPEYVQDISATENNEEIQITINSSRDWADFSIQFGVYKQSPGLIHWSANVSTNQSKVIDDNPRDLWFYDRTSHSLKDVSITKYSSQLKFAAGICYLYEDAINSSIFYFEDFSSLNDYFSLRQGWAPEYVVDASEANIGYKRPITPEITIPAETNFDIVDTYIYLTPGMPGSKREIAERFIYSLSMIYEHIYKPDIIACNWQDVASYELNDLLDDRCWVNFGGVDFLRAYVNIPRFSSAELIAQLDVLVAIEKYENIYGNVTDIDDMLEVALPYFYNTTHQTIVNDYPNEGITRGDSWYTMELAIGLARLAKMGNETANSLLFASTQSIINFAHNVDYEFPVFFEYGTNKPISGSEPDVAGGYAYLMLECYDLTGEQTYLDEAEASIQHIVGKGFYLSYELQMTAACATACARLYQITGNNEYLRMSYMPLANIMRTCWLWECDYGYASDYLTFFGMSPMQEAGVITMKEQYETWDYLKEYLNISKGFIPDYFNNLIEGFINYTPAVMRYSLAPFLPPEAVWTETTIYDAVNIPSMYVPLEDLREGWEKSGQIGQEIYGAGGPLCFAAGFSTIEESDTVCYPSKCQILKIYPNPFVKTTVIDYYLPGIGSTPTTLKIYNALGRLIRTLVNENQKPGKHSSSWDGKDSKNRALPNGSYFLRLDTGGLRDIKKILLIR
ncbi:MAG: DNRLRE domain-containing protein [candidate division WOR-3 bacterium]|nr:DNRLRE domain-containing protein [candidate division WOR-3 bacterium]